MYRLIGANRFGWLSACAIATVFALASATRVVAQGHAAARGADEQAIRESAAAFAEAFNRHDAPAIAQMWTVDGEYVDELGERFEGRDAIEKEYAEFFQAHPDAKLRIVVDSVHLPAADVAIEDGRAEVQPTPESGTGRGRYTAIHVKQKDGRWLVASVRDSRDESAAANGLRALDWLVGDWSVEHAGKRAEMTCRWNPAETFLERRFAVTEDGKITSSSTEIIAWDPVAEQIRSWTFASDGGRAEGVWNPRDNVWVVAHKGVMPDGTPTASIDVWAPLLGEGIGWRSVERSVGGTPVKEARDVVLKKRKPADGAKK